MALKAVSSRLRIAGEFLRFFAQTRWWWLLPVILLLLPLGVMLVFAQGSAIAPLIYTLF
jgi:hypothetical protein